VEACDLIIQKTSTRGGRCNNLDNYLRSHPFYHPLVWQIVNVLLLTISPKERRLSIRESQQLQDNYQDEPNARSRARYVLVVGVLSLEK
jgi:hypothetical protein